MKGILVLAALLLIVLAMVNGCGKDSWQAKNLSTGQYEVIMVSNNAKDHDTVIYNQTYYELIHRNE